MPIGNYRLIGAGPRERSRGVQHEHLRGIQPWVSSLCLQGTGSELLQVHTLSDSPTPPSLTCSQDSLPDSVASAFLVFGFWRHSSQCCQPSFTSQEPQKRFYRPEHGKAGRGALKTIKFNCRDDLMFSRQSTWRDLLKFPLLRVTSCDLILSHTSPGINSKNSKQDPFHWPVKNNTGG